MSSNDSELILSYLNVLQRGDNLGFGWSRKLNFLLQNNVITREQFDEYTIRHQNIKKGEKDKLKERVKCQACGDVINAGTYGIIFNSNNNVNNVIKGSIKGHSVTTGCPEDFEHEIIMYSKIYPVFKSFWVSLLYLGPILFINPFQLSNAKPILNFLIISSLRFLCFRYCKGSLPISENKFC